MSTDNPSTDRKEQMNDAQVKHMVDRFLQWRLPEHFNPDCGVSFAKPTRPYSDAAWWPVGTNLLDAQQAEAMVRHMIEGLPVHQDASAAPPDYNNPPFFDRRATPEPPAGTPSQVLQKFFRDSPAAPAGEREQFEKAFPALDFERTPPSDGTQRTYWNNTTENRWLGWQAARASAATPVPSPAAPPAWVSVKERLPQENTPVLVHGGVAVFYKNAGWWTRMECPEQKIQWAVTHWMPLPIPPKEEQ